MSRNSSIDYTKFVHQFEDKTGQTRYAVGEWNQKRGQFTRPLDSRTQKLTGCSEEFTQSLLGFGGYKTRAQALRRARYLFSYLEER
jgi:hypothetical protein